MEWARFLAYITGTVDRELLLRNEYLAGENRILKAQVRGRLCLSNADRATLGEIGHRLGRKALGEVVNAGLPDTILGCLFGERSLRRALSEYVRHYHAERNHQGKGNVLLFQQLPVRHYARTVQCRERLAGI
jgi:hypothetical protein